MSSLKDTDGCVNPKPTREELVAACKRAVASLYVCTDMWTRGPTRARTTAYATINRLAAITEQEFAALIAERDELAQQRGDLAARVLELERDRVRLDYIEEFARCDPKMDGQHVWWPTSFNHRLIGPTLRAAIDAARGHNVASDSQPSEQTR